MHEGNPEFQLIIKLSSPKEYEVSEEDISSINWEDFIQLIKEHRLGPLLFPRLLSSIFLSEIQKTELRQMLYSNKIYMFGLYRELAEVTKEFNKFDIKPCSQKGPVLSELIYGDVTLRQSKDLDLVVDFNDALSILSNLGYNLVGAPYHTDKQKEVYQKTHQECSLYHSEKGIEIDLHWFFYPPIIFKESIDTHVEFSEYDKIKGLKVLSKQDELLYLCFHGGRHRWFRLIWLYDVFTYLPLFSNKELKVVVSKAEKMGVSNFLLEAVYLSQVLFGYSIPDFIEPLLSSKIKALVRLLSIIYFQAFL